MAVGRNLLEHNWRARLSDLPDESPESHGLARCRQTVGLVRDRHCAKLELNT